MNDYISREAAEEVFRNARESLNARKYDYMANEYLTRDTMLLNAEQIIHALPAADVRPNMTGRWIFGVTMHHEWMKCSACNVSQYPNGCFSFCPNCGAKMKEGDA